MQQESLLLTSLVPHALAARAEVEGLPHSQLPQVDVSLIHIGCCAAWHELVEMLAIVGDVATNLQGRSATLNRNTPVPQLSQPVA